MSSSTIVSVEDSDTDFVALQHALKVAGVTNPIERCENGKEAAGYLLSRSSQLADWASLIVLDLNLPGIDGRDLLRKMRAQDPKRTVPIIVLSTSSHPKDIDASYRAGADAYMVKPLELEDWESKVGRLAQSWLMLKGDTASRQYAMKRKQPQKTTDALCRVMEREIVPRLLLAHCDTGLAPRYEQPKFIISEEEIVELTRLLFVSDVTVSSAYVAAIRAQGVPVGSLYVSLLAPAARLVGEWWRAERHEFAEVSLALSRLQQLTRDLAPARTPTTH
ncbi:MAG: response regulator [Pseudomonadota bacterium]